MKLTAVQLAAAGAIGIAIGASRARPGRPIPSRPAAPRGLDTAGAFVATGRPAPGADHDPPNVILLMVDDYDLESWRSLQTRPRPLTLVS